MSTAKKITVLLVEDHVVIRQSLCRLLEEDGQCHVVGQAKNGREAVDMAAGLSPDVILMDIAMPVLNGLGATRQILAADATAKVLVLSAHSDQVYVERMTAAGAVGFLEKQTSAAVLIHAIHEVAEGRSFFSPALAKRMSATKERSRDRHGLTNSRGPRLTPREAEVLQLVAEGHINKQVGTALGISLKTVEKHRQHVMKKFGLRGTADLTRYAMEHGIIESSVQVTIV